MHNDLCAVSTHAHAHSLTIIVHSPRKHGEQTPIRSNHQPVSMRVDCQALVRVSIVNNGQVMLMRVLGHQRLDINMM
jgi:hypothetical protein